jgi:geranylgeranyl diphosphate synthase type II
MTAKAASKGVDVMSAAIGIEYFVIAAKTADDLPSMDNSPERGKVQSVHQKFGYATSLLVTYALIAAGFQSLARQSEYCLDQFPESVGGMVKRFASTLQFAAFKIGASGACLGQFLDINTIDKPDESRIIEIIDAKTSGLYEMACDVGWAFGGGCQEWTFHIRELGKRLGRIMQMQDDLSDMEQDAALGRQANLANVYSYQKAEMLLRKEIEDYNRILKEIPSDTSELELLPLPILASINSYRQAAQESC